MVYFVWFRDGKTGLMATLPASPYGMRELGRFRAKEIRDGVPLPPSDGPSEVVVAMEGLDPSKQTEPRTLLQPPNLRYDSKLVENLFVVAVRRCLAPAALAAASHLLCVDAAKFMALLTAVLPREGPMHPLYGRAVWMWLALHGSDPDYRLDDARVELVLKIVREVASVPLREPPSAFVLPFTPGGVSPVLQNFSMDAPAPAAVSFHAGSWVDGVTKPLLLRTFCAAGATAPSETLSSLVALAATWKQRSCEERSRCHKDTVAGFYAEVADRPLYEKSHFFGPDLWENFFLAEAVPLKTPLFCLQVAEKAPNNRLLKEEDVRQVLAPWWDGYQPRRPWTTDAEGRDEQALERIQQARTETEEAFYRLAPTAHYVAHLHWQPVTDLNTFGGKPNKPAASTPAPNAKPPSRFAPKPKRTAQPTMLDFLHS